MAGFAYDKDLLARSSVLRLSATGRSNTAIARELAIAPFSVSIHVSGVLKALGVDSRASAAALAGEGP